MNKVRAVPHSDAPMTKEPQVTNAGIDKCRPFEPMIRKLSELKETLHFDVDTPILLSRAPGRLDVMGGIADYSGSLVLELPLACATYAALQETQDGIIEITSAREGRLHVFRVHMEDLWSGPLTRGEALSSWFAENEKDHWAAYPVGLVHYCLHRTSFRSEKQPDSFRLFIDSEVPEGKGVSSSAALEVACMAVIAKHFDIDLTNEEIALACQWVENTIVGAPCGIMDQMTSVFGKKDKLLRLLCQPAQMEGFCDIPGGYGFYGIDSGVRHAVSGADYGTVRTAAFMGYRIIAEMAGLDVYNEGHRVRVDDPRWHGYLANLTPQEYKADFEAHLPEVLSGSQFLTRYGGITDRVTTVLSDRTYPVKAATAHPIFEHARVRRFTDLLNELKACPDAAIEMGQLMYESHESYNSCGLGSEATDLIVEMVREAGKESGLYGAKITGGGSGGTVAIFGTVDAAEAVRAIAAEYQKKSGRAATVFSGSSTGLAETGLLELRLGL